MPTLESPCPPGYSARLLASALLRPGWVKEQKYKNRGWDSYAENLQFKFSKCLHFFYSRKRFRELQRKMDDLRTARLEQLRKKTLAWQTGELFDRGHKARQPKCGPLTEVATLKHSGNSGDVIYALATMRALSNGHPAKLFLNLDAPINNWSEAEHPLGKSGLTAGMVDFLRPLLEFQPWLTFLEIHNGEAVDYDLDAFRFTPGILLGRGHIAHWNLWVFPLSLDLTQPWLELPPVASRNKIVLARSARYRNPYLDYAFLRDCGEIDFVGTRPEFLEMKQTLPRLCHVACPDALHLAQVIKSARFFIGNQSFPFAIAEALKVPRILEVYPEIPDVIPSGGKTGEAFFQSNFEILVKKFLEQTAS